MKYKKGISKEHKEMFISQHCMVSLWLRVRLYI